MVTPQQGLFLAGELIRLAANAYRDNLENIKLEEIGKAKVAFDELDEYLKLKEKP